MRDHQYRRTSAVVDNPIRDKRVKYGEQGIESIPAYTFFRYLPASERADGRWTDPATAELVDGRYLSSQGFIRRLVDASSPAAPVTVQEYMFHARLSPQYMYDTMAVLEEVFRMSPVTVQLAIDRVRAAQDEDSEKSE